MSKALLFLTIICLSYSLFGQNKLRYKQIEKMDRISIINLAKQQLNNYLDMVNDSTFDYYLIDTIRILKNKKKYFVRFEKILKYVPLNTSYYFGFNIDLLENDISKILVLNSKSNNPISFYQSRDQDLKHISFVQKALSIEKNKEPVVIREKEKYYEIGYISSGEKVDKISGNRFDWWDEILYIDPDEMLVETKLK